MAEAAEEAVGSLVLAALHGPAAAPQTCWANHLEETPPEQGPQELLNLHDAAGRSI